MQYNLNTLYLSQCATLNTFRLTVTLWLIKMIINLAYEQVVVKIECLTLLVPGNCHITAARRELPPAAGSKWTAPQSLASTWLMDRWRLLCNQLKSNHPPAAVTMLSVVLIVTGLLSSYSAGLCNNSCSTLTLPCLGLLFGPQFFHVNKVLL